ADQQPGLVLDKSAEPSEELVLGETITYTFTATNTGNTTLTGVEIEDTEFDAAGELSELECDPAQPATLAPGEVLECTATYTVEQADVDAGEITNAAVVCDEDGTCDEDDVIVPHEQDPAIELTKSADVSEFSAVGEVITYSFIAENTGDVTLTDVVIAETAFSGAGEMSELTCD